MKVVWKIVLVFALALLILGVALIAVSLFSGGSIEGVRNNVPLIRFEQSFPDETITALRVEVPARRLTVEPGEVLRVEANNVSESGFYCGVQDGVLIVREKQDNSWSNNLSRMISFGKREPEYHIWLPDGLTLTRADVEMTAGEARVQSLSADVFQLKMAAGSAGVESLRAQAALIDMAAGSLSLFDLDTQVLSLQSAAAGVGVSGTVRSHCVVDLGAGAAVLRLTGNAADYAAQLEVAAGAIDYNGTSLTLGRLRVGRGENAMSLRCGAGSIEVEFFG